MKLVSIFVSPKVHKFVCNFSSNRIAHIKHTAKDMILPLEIIQQIVDYLPAKNLRNCVQSYHTCRQFQRWPLYSHLRVPYNVSKGAFVFALLLDNIELAILCQSKPYQDRFFKTAEDDGFQNALKNNLNNSRMLDLLERECSFVMNPEDLNCGKLHDKDSIIWWIKRGYSAQKIKSNMMVLLIEKHSQVMDDYFSHITATNAQKIARCHPIYTHKVWHALKDLSDSINYLLYLTHPNIQAIIRSHTPHNWFNYLMSLGLLKSSDPHMINMSSVMNYLCENAEDLSLNEWMSLHNQMMNYTKVNIPLYVLITRRLWSTEKHLVTFLGNRHRFGNTQGSYSRTILFLYHLLPHLNFADQDYFRTDDTEILFIYFTTKHADENRCRTAFDFEMGCKVGMYMIANIKAKEEDKANTCQSIANALCSIDIMYHHRPNEFFYPLLDLCLQKSLQRIYMGPYIKYPPRGEKWKPHVQELLILFRTHVLPQWTLKKAIERIYGNCWIDHWKFSENDELFSIISDDDEWTRLDRCDLAKYWRSFFLNVPKLKNL